MSSEFVSPDAISEATSKFYDQFPFPSSPLIFNLPQECDWHFCFDAVYSFCTGVHPSYRNIFEPIRILDAGCGSGVSTNCLAYFNQGAEILAVDISGGALEVAAERLRRSGCIEFVDLRFHKESLFNLSDEGLFDYINSIGVLHHLNDPSAGLKALSSLLSPSGLMHISIYSSAGRWAIQRIHRTLNMLGFSDHKADVKLARKLFENLPFDNEFRCNFKKKWFRDCQVDADFADMFLHPYETSFSLDELFELISEVDLYFAGFSNPQVWDLSRLLRGEFLERAISLSQFEQWKLIEELDTQIISFDFFLSKSPISIHEWSDDNQILNATAKINPCFPKNLLKNGSVLSNGRHLRLNPNSKKLLEAVEEAPFVTPLRSLNIGVDSSVIASLARDLQEQQVLLLLPG